MSRQVSRGSAGECQADEQAGVTRLRWRVSGMGGWTPGFGDGQGGLACCGSWARKELDMTERLN